MEHAPDTTSRRLSRHMVLCIEIAGLTAAFFVWNAVLFQTEADHGAALINPANVPYQEMTEANRRARFQRVIPAACTEVTETVFRGFQKDRTAVWLARCAGGLDFQLSIPLAVNASPQIAPCGPAAQDARAADCSSPLE